MKQDLRASREKNSVYISHERYAQEEAEKKLKDEKIEQPEIDLNISEKEVKKYRELYESEQEKRLNIESDVKGCKESLENSNKALLDIQGKHSEAVNINLDFLRSFLSKKAIYIQKNAWLNMQKVWTNFMMHQRMFIRVCD